MEKLLNFEIYWMSYHLITASSMFDAELDIALVVDTAGVRELVGLEPDQGRGLAGAVLELPHDLIVHGTPLGVDQVLVTPAQSVPDAAAGHVHPVDVLVIDTDHQSQRIANLHILRHQTLWWFTIEDPHTGWRHGCCSCQRGCSKSTEKKNK